MTGAAEPSSHSAHDHCDDLLFFVKLKCPKDGDGEPFFVRRKAKQLPAELQLAGPLFDGVDWSKTVLLNVVLQSAYQLTVVACRHVIHACRLNVEQICTVTGIMSLFNKASILATSAVLNSAASLVLFRSSL